MILTVLPVLPAGLRPVVELDSGGFASSDFNELYRRVVTQNNRIKQFLQSPTPQVILQREERKLQDAVDALLENGRNGYIATARAASRRASNSGSSGGRRPLRSLSDTLKGKFGRFRQTLLGKRVDFSGRSVIVVDPELKLHQCGLPKKMAVVLFEPFLERRLLQLGHSEDRAEEIIARQTAEVWEPLQYVTKNHPILLNRAPSLHRLSIQAFEPVLVEGEAIRIHPLVCTGYNADFDGDTMAVFVPLSAKARREARLLMMSTGNLLNPGNGQAILAPTHDMVLGCHYLTADPRAQCDDPVRLMLFGCTDEVLFALESKALRTHSRILFSNPDFKRDTVCGDPHKRLIETTAGRVMFNEVWPPELGFINHPVCKENLNHLVWTCHKHLGPARTIHTLERLKELGFREATRSGCSVGIDDIVIPPEKEREIAVARQTITVADDQVQHGIITPGERASRAIDAWSECIRKVMDSLKGALQQNLGRPEYNPLSLMLESGARATTRQVLQLAGMRGLMVRPTGEIIEHPILANFREGLTPLEFFISTHGARKGLADTALKTSAAGYLTRKLVSVAEDIIVRESDCGTTCGILCHSVSERITGRLAASDIPDPRDPAGTIIKAKTEIDDEKARLLQDLGIKHVRVRSPLTCETLDGVCAACYGRNLATGATVSVGDAVGVIAAQSIGEPGTQLTMRTFHTGGVANPVVPASNGTSRNSGDITGGLPRVNELFEARSPKDPCCLSGINGIVHFGPLVRGKRTMSVHDAYTGREEKHLLPPGKTVRVSEGDTVIAGQQLTDGPTDPHRLLQVSGPETLQRWLVDEITQIYRFQGVSVSEKHVEIIVRQMLRKIRILDPGETPFLPGQDLDAVQVEAANKRINADGGKPAKVRPLLAGISQTALKVGSFMRAASFQQPTSVLAEAAALCKTDPLTGVKERLLVGGVIPIGTGFHSRTNPPLPPGP
jgi:DNA-directed RNA polymerase subunit beta'